MARRSPPPGARRPPGARPGPARPPRGPAPHAAPDSAPTPARDPTYVLLGEFGRAHGLAGEVRLKSYTADPAAIGSYGALRGADGRTVEITALRPTSGAPDILIARVAGIAGRNAAEALNRLALYVPRDRLGLPEDEDEFFSADLVGLAVTDAAGRHLGTVRAVPNYGGGDLLEIAPAGGGATALLPFTRAFVPAIDLAARTVTVDPPDDLFAPAAPPPSEEA
ncbi:MAG: ribosome maturation factor RimM [Methylobacterium sp.]|uniref:ribosome maturation factor RimM n=1 Tax=Methylobacterium sp. TaxID=409 RepID=UPI0025833AA0|nr:ribosome maturation factor RimM [Methylobacterium sp.]MBY0295971.1 ribosome maturation factor RimM [Methylobacterium sp.]